MVALIADNLNERARDGFDPTESLVVAAAPCDGLLIYSTRDCICRRTRSSLPYIIGRMRAAGNDATELQMALL